MTFATPAVPWHGPNCSADIPPLRYHRAAQAVSRATDSVVVIIYYFRHVFKGVKVRLRVGHEDVGAGCHTLLEDHFPLSPAWVGVE